VPDLLLHSMSEFAAIITDMLDAADARSVVEIGAEYGGLTQILAERAADIGGTLTSIDPAPKPEFVEWVAGNPHVTHLARPSLQALDAVRDVDAWTVDGDHNWFTVYHELKLIDAICRRDSRPMLVFLHDVAWPSGRRDMYYAPETIPAQFRHSCDYDGGALPGVDALVPGRGFRGMGHFAWADHEGGPRNGVMTAIEDFMADLEAAGRSLAFAEIPAVFGLGILFDVDQPWSETIGQLILPYHDNPLIGALEANRLANYLRVLDYQDKFIS
jgi:hypothetical protein